PYPTDWFNVLQNGERITQIHNNNYGNVNVKAMNTQMANLAALPPDQALSSQTNAKWATMDRDFMTKYASTVPFLNGILTSFFSTKMNVDCDIFDDNQDDLAQFCQKYGVDTGAAAHVRRRAGSTLLNYPPLEPWRPPAKRSSLSTPPPNWRRRKARRRRSRAVALGCSPVGGCDATRSRSSSSG